MESDKMIKVSEVMAVFSIQYEAMERLLDLFRRYVGATRCGTTFSKIGTVDYVGMFFDMVNMNGIFKVVDSHKYCQVGEVGSELYNKVERMRASRKNGRLRLASAGDNGNIAFLDDGRLDGINMLEVMDAVKLTFDTGPCDNPSDHLYDKYEYKVSADMVMHTLNEVLSEDDGVHLLVAAVEDNAKERAYVVTLKAFDEKGCSVIRGLTRSINNDTFGRRSEVL